MHEPLTAIEQYIVNYVRQLRIQKKISQREIGEILGVDQSFIAKVEKKSDASKYNLNHINTLANYFKISPRDFLPLTAFENKIRKKL